MTEPAPTLFGQRNRYSRLLPQIGRDCGSRLGWTHRPRITDMKPTPEVEAQGLKAYERVCAFEQLRRRRLPLFYAAVSTVWIVIGLWAWGRVHNTYTVLNLIVGIVFAVGCWLHWLKLKHNYLRNLDTVNGLERTYGDALSWVQVEKHFAEIEKIQQEERESRKK